ncbi:MAG: MTAP family purine nucleoside phosphorylase [Patescibacteria group bacterium]
MKNYKIGVIGGSGIYTLQDYKFFAGNFDNEYKDSELGIEKYKFSNCEIYFLSRHGKNHMILPHEIDYLTNIKAFDDLKVDCIISFCTVGSLDSNFQPGLYVTPKDIIDFTYNRKGWNYTKENKHVDIQPVFGEDLMRVCKQLFNNINVPLNNEGTLVVIEGPRFATLAEQNMYKIFGGSFLNMTQAQEIYLSHVFQIPFISLCHITDLTSIVNKNYDLTSSDAISVFKSNYSKVERILSALVKYLSENKPEIKYHSDKQTFV